MKNPLPTKALVVSPGLLSEAIQDGVKPQIIDRRSEPSDTKNDSFFPQAMRLFPHEVEGSLPDISKQCWIVLVDDGNRVAQPIAERLFQQGFVLTLLLEGGYPAWVNAKD